MPEYALEPDPEALPLSAELVDMAEDMYWSGWAVWQQLRAEPPSILEVVVLAQLKSPLQVEGGPSEYGSGSGE